MQTNTSMVKAERKNNLNEIDFARFFITSVYLLFANTFEFFYLLFINV